MAESTTQNQAHLYEIVKDFDTVMLVTRTMAGIMRSRPMALADVKDGGELFFATSIDSPKVHELESDPHVNVSMQGKTQYASISGTGRIVQDRELIDTLWSEDWKVWFPNGKEDPSLCLLAVQPQEGEYWDNAGAKGIKYAFEAAKAYVTGTTPSQDEDQNAKVKLA